MAFWSYHKKPNYITLYWGLTHENTMKQKPSQVFKCNHPIRLTVKFNLWSMEYKFLFAKVHAFMEHIQSRMYDKTNGIDRTDDKFEFKEHKITGKTSLIVIKIFFIRNWNTFDHYGLQIVNSIFWDFSMEKALNFCIYHDEIGIECSINEFIQPYQKSMLLLPIVIISRI